MRLEFLQAGEIVTTHGVRGEIKLLPWVDSPEFMLEFKRVRIDGVAYKVENCRVQKTCNLMKLAGVDTMEAAQAMRGKTVEIYREDVDSSLIFAAELIGMRVFAGEELIGSITDVYDYPGNKVYVVEGDYTYLIPGVKEFILSTDLDKNIMQVKLIEGMRADES